MGLVFKGSVRDDDGTATRPEESTWMSATRRGIQPPWIARTPHEPLAPNAAGRWYPATTRSTCLPRASNTPDPAPCCGRGMSHWRSWGDPAAGDGHPVVVPHHRTSRRARGGRHHRDRSRRTLPAPAVPAGLVPVRHRRGQRPLLPVLCDAAPRPRFRRPCPAGIPAGGHRARRGMGGFVPDHEGHQRHLGHPARTGLTACSTASARR